MTENATDPRTVEAPTPRRGLWRQQKRWAPYVFLAPALFYFLVFFLAPILFALYLTFTRWNPLSVPQWTGLANYEYLLTRDPTFYLTLFNTLLFAFGTVALGIPLSLLVAFLINMSKGKSVWRSIYWLPMITNVVAVGFIWAFLLDGTYGIVNRMLATVGIAGPNWLTDSNTAMIAVIIVAVWVGIGQNMLLFSAGLEGIDESYYEAARIDGASIWDIFWHVTLPLLRPTLLFVSVTSFIAGMGAFTLILVIGDQANLRAIRVTALYMYEMAFQDLRMGRASAAAFILFVIIFLITLVQLRVFRRGGVEPY